MAGEKKSEYPCLICGGVPDREALYLRGAWICSACEERLLRTTPEAPSYALFKARIELLWRREIPHALVIKQP